MPTIPDSILVVYGSTTLFLFNGGFGVALLWYFMLTQVILPNSDIQNYWAGFWALWMLIVWVHQRLTKDAERILR